MGINPDKFDSKAKSGTVFRSQVVLLVDVSQSMGNRGRIDELTAGVTTFLNEDLAGTGMLDQGEIAVGAFNSSVEWLKLGPKPTRPGSPFYRMTEVSGLQKELEAISTTGMADAILEAIEIIDERQKQLPTENLAREHKPQLFLITDGAPDDDQDMAGVEELLHRRALYAETANLLFFALGVRGAKMETLRKLAPQSHYDAADHPIRDLLRWVSESINDSINGSAAATSDPYSPEYRRVHQSINSSIFSSIRKGNATVQDT